MLLKNIRIYIIEKLNKSVFAKNVLLIGGGVVFAQSIQLIFSPILTRLYTPEQFGVLSIYLSLISVMTNICTLKYEMAILIPKQKKSAIALTYISFIILLISCMVMILVLGISQNIINNIFGNQYLHGLSFAIPLGTFLVGTYQILSYFAVREQQYSILAKTKINQSFTQVIFQLLMGFFYLKPLSLVAGDIAGRIGGIWSLFNLLRKEMRKTKISFLSIKRLIIRFRHYPLFTSVSSFINSLGVQLPSLLFTIIYGVNIGGYFSLVQRVLGVPISVISQSVSQVYLGELTSYLKSEGKNKNIKSLFVSTALKLFSLGVIPSLILIVFGPDLFGVFFGAHWRTAGEFIRPLSLMFLVQFVVLPLSQTLIILERQKIQLIWDISRFIIVCSGFYAVSMLKLEVEISIIIYSLFMTIAYIILFILSYKTITDIQRKHINAAN
jgi:O-antigen/teichoic acid export membrane protein